MHGCGGYSYNTFSSFSVGSCINEEKVICYQLEFGNYFANVSTECSSRHQGKSEKVLTNAAIYGHALLRIRVVDVYPQSYFPNSSWYVITYLLHLYHMRQSRVENERVFRHILIALLRLKCCITELVEGRAHTHFVVA